MDPRIDYVKVLGVSTVLTVLVSIGLTVATSDWRFLSPLIIVCLVVSFFELLFSFHSEG